MANPEHSKLLKQGVSAWNTWRQEHPKIHPNLVDIALRGADLRGVDLQDADIRGADLIETDLSKGKLKCANLIGATIVRSDLTATNLELADFSWANLHGVNLTRANLSNAGFIATNFHSTILAEANIVGARLQSTVFADIDLSTVKGLISVRHMGPSSVGLDTVLRSKGQIPDQFLREVGVPEELIDIARSIRTGPPIQWHSCFISYSTKDEEFARQLHERMRAANMRVWFAPEDLKGGKKLHEQLFEAIQIYDRLLIVLSEHSIQSEWVMTEIRKARETEKKEKRRKLFPIRLADFETLRDWTCFDADTGKDLAVEVREYFIPDFSNWKDHDAFESAFARLKKDLEAET